jgi:hypothetical protein
VGPGGDPPQTESASVVAAASAARTTLNKLVYWGNKFCEAELAAMVDCISSAKFVTSINTTRIYMCVCAEVHPCEQCSACEARGRPRLILFLGILSLGNGA